jgi:CTP:molybdopterin cytidylyltransferase MocA
VTVAGILLAAARFDHAGQPLALAQWTGDETLIDWETEQMLVAGVEAVEVVLGYEAERIIPVVARDNVEPIIDPAWQHDAASALRVGSTAVPRGTSASVIVDLTRPRASAMLSALLDAHEAHGARLTRPQCADRAGWPVIAGAEVLAELRNARAGSDAIADAARRHAGATQLLEWGAEALAEIATAADFEAVRRALVFGG